MAGLVLVRKESAMSSSEDKPNNAQNLREELTTENHEPDAVDEQVHAEVAAQYDEEVSKP
jgi:hypothetical protein